MRRAHQDWVAGRPIAGGARGGGFGTCLFESEAGESCHQPRTHAGGQKLLLLGRDYAVPVVVHWTGTSRELQGCDSGAWRGGDLRRPGIGHSYGVGRGLYHWGREYSPRGDGFG